MTTSEAASGPRYAPDDPTLPKPWKGLIDGSSLYYWNPETNVTQYEKPVAGNPPLSAVPTVAVTVPQSDSSPMTQPVQSNGIIPQHGQHIQNVPQQQTQYMNQIPHQHGAPQVAGGEQPAYQRASQMAQVGHLGSQPGQGFQPQYMHYGQGMQPTAQQSGQLSAQQGQAMHHQSAVPQPGQPMTQHTFMQIRPQFGQHAPTHQGGPVGPQMQPHFSYQQQPQQQPQQQQPQQHHQQQQYMQYPQTMLGPGHQQTQYMQQGPSYLYQSEHHPGYPPQRADNEQGGFPKVNPTAFSPSQAEQAGNVAPQSLPASNTPNASRAGGLTNQFPSIGTGTQVQPSNSTDQLRNTATEAHPQHGQLYDNHMGNPMMHSQQHGRPPIGSNASYPGNQQGRVKQEYIYNDQKGAPAMAPEQPKLAPIPMARHQQEMRFGPQQNAPRSHADGMNTVSDHGFPKHYSHGGGDLSVHNHAMTREAPVPGPSDMTLTSVEAYCRQHEVTATGENVPAPFMTFEATGFPPEILREMHAAGFSSPTPIQAQTWPIAMQKKDIVATAKTGSGKTLGYLIPAFLHLRRLRNNPLRGPTVLVLAPTRELAVQIQEEVLKFGRSSRVSCTCLYGGAPKGNQLRELELGADIVVATPGRLNDILEMKKIEFGQVSLLVLDEADRMLDMGFEPQIRKIVNEIPPHRQTLMYTATWPKEVRKIASDLLVNPVQVNIGSVDELAANKAITQYVEIVPLMEKQRRLEQILRAQERGSKVIVFCSTKKLCDELARGISRHNFPAAAIHGDKNQGERDWVLNQFREGKTPILVATDVAARGLDIKDIRVVINYDFPTGVEDYVHRIGRTGRAGATGVAYTFFSEQDWKHAADLVKVLEGANQVVPPEIRDIALRGAPPFARDRGAMNRFEPGSSGGYDRGGFSHGGMRDGGFGGRGGMRDGGSFGGRGGMREDGGFNGRGGMREDGGFGGRGGMREGGGFGGRGGMREGGFGGRGGGFSSRGGMRDSGFDSHNTRDSFSARGGRSDFFGGRGNRGRGFGGPSGDRGGWNREDRGPMERFNRDGYGRGRGRGRFDGRRDSSGRSRGRSYSPSPEKVRTWRHSSSRSRSRSWTRSRSRSRSWSRSHSPRRSYSRGRDRNRSRSRSYDRHQKLEMQDADQKDLAAPAPEEPAITQNPDQKDIQPLNEVAMLVPPTFPISAGPPDSSIPSADDVNASGSETMVDHGDHQPVSEI